MVPTRFDELSARAAIWLEEEGVWWASSCVFHALLMIALMLVGVKTPARVIEDETSVEIGQAEDLHESFPVERMQDLTPQYDSTRLTTLSVLDPGQIGLDKTSAEHVPAPYKEHVAPGGSGWPATTTLVRIDGPGRSPWSSDAFKLPPVAEPTETPNPFIARDPRQRPAIVKNSGVTRATDNAVGAALKWFVRHQNRDGSWSLDGYRTHCKDATCSGPGAQRSDAAATALALLPLLAAGNRHDRRDPNGKAVAAGLHWLLGKQRPNGDLSAGSSQRMYSHGLAAIALCEAYGMTGDPFLRDRTQLAIDFIEKSQHPRTGGWRYQPGDEGDTSVFGWQLMALKSAEIAALKVRPEAFERSLQWLQATASGKSQGLFSYTPGSPASPSMTAVGLLASQYLHVPRNAPAMTEGTAYLMSHPPEARSRSLYYWYYATQVLHNLLGPDWDQWNRKMRRVLVETQVREGCAAGSWDPLRPTRDPLGEPGGRLCVTSLATLTLEVYYRHLPLYKLDSETAAPDPENGPRL